MMMVYYQMITILIYCKRDDCFGGSFVAGSHDWCFTRNRCKRWVWELFLCSEYVWKSRFFYMLMNNSLCLMSLSFIDMSLFTFLDVISCLLCVLFSDPWLGEHVKPPKTYMESNHAFLQTSFFCMFEVPCEFPGTTFDYPWSNLGMPFAWLLWSNLPEKWRFWNKQSLQIFRTHVFSSKISSNVFSSFSRHPNLPSQIDSLKEAGKIFQGKAPITSGWFWPPFSAQGALGDPFFCHPSRKYIATLYRRLVTPKGSLVRKSYPKDPSTLICLVGDFLPVGEYLVHKQVIFIVKFLGQVYTNWICFCWVIFFYGFDLMG